MLTAFPLPTSASPVLNLDVPEREMSIPLAPEPRAGVRAAAPTPTTTPSTSHRSVRIRIRVPFGLLEEFRVRATTESAGYQTLMVRAMRDWLPHGGHPQSRNLGEAHLQLAGLRRRIALECDERVGWRSRGSPTERPARESISMF